MARPRAPVAPLPSKAPVQVDDPQHGSWGAQSAPDGTTQFYQYTAAGWSEAARAAVPPAVRLALLTALLTPPDGPPRALRPNGFLVPVEGDLVFRTIPAVLGEAYAHGVVVRARGGKLRVRIGSTTDLLSTQPAGDKLADLESAWFVRDDPEFERRKIVKETYETEQRAAEQRTDALVRAAIDAHLARGALPVTPENLNHGRIQPGGRITYYVGMSGCFQGKRHREPSVDRVVSFVVRVDRDPESPMLWVVSADDDDTRPELDGSEFPETPSRWPMMVYEPPHSPV